MRARRPSWALVLALAWGLPSGFVHAQEPAALPADVLQRFEERLQALEEENRALREQVQGLAESRPSMAEDDAPSAPSAPSAGTRSAPEDEAPSAGTRSAPEDQDPSTAGDTMAATALGAPVMSTGPTASVGTSRGSRKRIPLKAWLGQGFEFSSEDDEFQLQFHNETQVDYRLFDQTGQGTVHNGFFIPRQIWSLNGRFTKNIEYMASFQRGLSSFEMRDVYMNFKVLDKDRLMIRAGRFRTPYTYEYYAISNTDLIAPERSVYNLNFSNLREIGVMAWGLLGDDRVDYAAGLFNGVRNGFEDMNDEPSFIGYINYRPFRHSERLPALKYLNIGASADVGNQGNNTQEPLALRTAVNASLASGASTASPAFLSFNKGAREDGMKALGSVHAALFYNRLSLIGEMDFGQANYIARPSALPSERVGVPINGYTVQAGYFLTGEHVTRRGPIDVKRPFNLKRGQDFGLGAFELGARYATLGLGEEVFTGGLADPNLWSTNVQSTDVGVNWYLNRYLDWQHSEFGAPVTFGRGRFLTNSELYWMRLQFLF
jgi:phosphate-selective porin OprO/OprP